MFMNDVWLLRLYMCVECSVSLCKYCVRPGDKKGLRLERNGGPNIINLKTGAHMMV